MPWTQLGPAGEPGPVIAYEVQVGDEVLTVHPSDVTIVRLGPPAARGDATRPDPAVKQAIRAAIYEVRHRPHEGLTTDCHKQVERELVPLWHEWGDVLEALAAGLSAGATGGDGDDG